jgi:methylmalonyl-CoA epimerase
LGLDLSGEDTVATEAVRVLFLPVGESRVELLEPVGDEGPLQRFLANRGPGLHHICLEVDDLPGMMAQLKGQGVRLLDEEPRVGAHNTLVAFVHPKSAGGVLVELVQSEPE